ncbi:MAG: putative CoA-binding protein [Oleiphilaceae bacterium]|jgi:predicted CoA-binding protein
MKSCAFYKAKDLKIYPVSPILAGQYILNEQVYAFLEDNPVIVDLVEIYRNSEAAGCRREM